MGSYLVFGGAEGIRETDAAMALDGKAVLTHTGCNKGSMTTIIELSRSRKTLKARARHFPKFARPSITIWPTSEY